jgi:hypothetical protein
MPCPLQMRVARNGKWKSLSGAHRTAFKAGRPWWCFSCFLEQRYNVRSCSSHVVTERTGLRGGTSLPRLAYFGLSLYERK